MKFPFFTKPQPPPPSPSWPWPACGGNPKTLSFRANNSEIFKTINSAYLDVDECFSELETICDDNSSGADESAVVGALKSARLFFSPGETSSILDEAKSTPHNSNSTESLDDAVSILTLESRDPYADFRASMEEMVAAHGLKDWDGLEDLLACYLRVNSKANQGYIVGAFVDLLLRLAVAATSKAAVSAIDENCSSSSTTTTARQNSFTSPLSFCSSSPTYSSPEIETPITAGAGENEKSESEASASNNCSD